MKRVARVYSGGAESFVPEVDGVSARTFAAVPRGQLHLLGQGELFTTASDLA